MSAARPAHQHVRAQSLSLRPARTFHRHAARGRQAARQETGTSSQRSTPAEQRAMFERMIAPLFDYSSVRLLSKSAVSLYALGIPPAQYDELVASAGGNPIAVLRERVERLACDFPIHENYFAWQAFGRGYDIEDRATRCRPICSARTTRRSVHGRDRVEVHHASLTDFLAEPAGALAAPLRAARRAGLDERRPDHRAVDRDRPHRRRRGCPRHLPHRRCRIRRCRASCRPDCWRRGCICEAESKAFHAQDRSSIYGGFHVYTRRRPLDRAVTNAQSCRADGPGLSPSALYL